MKSCHILATALWLVFSPMCHAVTFNFQAVSGDLDQVNFEATIVLSDPTPGEVNARIDDSRVPDISASSNFEALIFSFASGVGSQSASITQEVFDLELQAIGIVGLRFGPDGEGFFSYFTGGEVSDFGFLGQELDSSGLWAFRFSDEASEPDFFLITGRFIQIPEPGGLALLGLVLVGAAVGRRSYGNSRFFACNPGDLRVQQQF